MPSARRRHFCLLLLPGKSMAFGGTRAAGFAFALKKDKEQQIINLSPTTFQLLDFHLFSLLLEVI